MIRAAALLAAALLLAPLAQAHTGLQTTSGSGVLAGLLHPFGGLDHILAAIAVGLWAGQLGGRSLWTIPTTFLATMLVGAWLAARGLQLPWVETGIACSVLLLGLILAGAARLPVWSGMLLTGAFALLHGHAHGQELSATLSPAEFLAGLALATASLNVAGIGLALLIARRHAAGWLRASGGVMAVCGCVLLALRA